MKIFGQEFKFNGFDVLHSGNVNPTRIPYFINGTGSVAGTWLGSEANIASYYDGLSILYKVPIAGAATTTLNLNGLGSKTIYRYGSSKLTTHYPVDSVLLLIYSETLNGGCFMTEGSDYDSTSDYEMRWQNNITAGATMYGYQIVMEGIDGKFYPLTLEGNTGTSKTVSSAEFKLGGTILYHGTATDLATNANGGGYYLWTEVYTGNLHYTINNPSGWAIAYRPVYLVGTINANGNFVLDGAGVTGSTAWITQTLPTTDNGKVYILLGIMNDTYAAIRIMGNHPMYVYRDGSIKLYTPNHTHTKAQITDMPTNLSQFVNDIGAGSGIVITVDSAAPGSPSPGDFWYQTV